MIAGIHRGGSDAVFVPNAGLAMVLRPTQMRSTEVVRHSIAPYTVRLVLLRGSGGCRLGGAVSAALRNVRPAG